MCTWHICLATCGVRVVRVSQQWQFRRPGLADKGRGGGGETGRGGLCGAVLAVSPRIGWPPSPACSVQAGQIPVCPAQSRQCPTSIDITCGCSAARLWGPATGAACWRPERAGSGFAARREVAADGHADARQTAHFVIGRQVRRRRPRRRTGQTDRQADTSRPPSPAAPAAPAARRSRRRRRAAALSPNKAESAARD